MDDINFSNPKLKLPPEEMEAIASAIRKYLVRNSYEFAQTIANRITDCAKSETYFNREGLFLIKSFQPNIPMDFVTGIF